MNDYHGCIDIKIQDQKEQEDRREKKKLFYMGTYDKSNYDGYII